MPNNLQKVLACLCLTAATPQLALAQYHYGYGQPMRRAPQQQQSQFISAQQLCNAADRAELAGNYAAAFALYKQGCGITAGRAKVVASGEETNYFRYKAAQMFPRGLVQLKRNRGGQLDLIREGDDLFSRLVQVDPSNGLYHLRWGEIQYFLDEPGRARDQFTAALPCSNMTPEGRTYAKSQIAIANKAIARKQAFIQHADLVFRDSRNISTPGIDSYHQAHENDWLNAEHEAFLGNMDQAHRLNPSKY